ncbi:MAG: ABC transporter ATP-binding protein [Lachnospiraceae bacterium]|nr:ABC transporter ATP-binding protein [Lachnospiraceae bacterium]
MAANKTNIKPYVHAFYKGGRLRFAAVLLLTVLSALPNLIVSWLLGEILDIIAASNLHRLLRLLSLLPFLFLLIVLLNVLLYRTKSRFIHGAMRRYKSTAFSRISEKSISAFSTENTGRYLSVLSNDLSAIEENYLNRSFLLIFDCVSFVGALTMMFWCSWELAAAALFLSALPIAVSLCMGGELTRREQAVSNRNESYMSTLKDLLQGFSVIKSFQAEAQAKQLYESANAAAEKAKDRRRFWDGLMVTVSGGCGMIFQFGIFFLGAFLAIRGRITAGTVLIIVNLCNFILSPIEHVPQYWAGRRAAEGLIEKLADAASSHTAASGVAIPPTLTEAIALERVSFGYEPEKPVLKDLSLRFEAGKKYAVVGGSGSGKSTLLHLLMGAHADYTGSVTIDGRELKTIDTDSLYNVMSLIGQSVFLFDSTIANNITMFREFPKEQLDDAVRRSGLTQLLAERGGEYRCGENGAGLSGGERQRISIARCLLRGTPVLLLDEATAALDNQTAYAVTDSILHLNGLTRIVVTHRLERGLMKQYDEIVVLRDGSVLERGSFDALMAQKGYFYSLFTLSA